MLKELIEKNRFSFHDGFEKWEDAIKAACMPLIKDKAIEEAYIDSIISNVNKYGPYIVIAPDICIPHAQEGTVGVNETAVCFMRSKKPVCFSDENNEVVEELICSQCKEDLENIYKDYFLPA